MTFDIKQEQQSMLEFSIEIGCGPIGQFGKSIAEENEFVVFLGWGIGVLIKIVHFWGYFPFFVICVFRVTLRSIER